MLQTLPGGSYTAQVTPARADVAPGVALVEVYDVDQLPESLLINLSTRASVGTGANSLIAGYVIAGGGSQPLLIRRVGSALTAFGVSSVLADPVLTLFDKTGAVIAANDDWQSAANSAQVAAAAGSLGAFTLAPASKDAALLARPDRCRHRRPAAPDAGSAPAAGKEKGKAIAKQ